MVTFVLFATHDIMQHMNIAERLTQCERQFEQKKTEREQYVQAAEECLTEMTKLQGEFRLLQELQAAGTEEKSTNKKPNVIEAVPDKEGK